MHSIDNEINRLIKLKEEVENCKELIQNHPDVLFCSSKYFHNYLNCGAPQKAETIVFVVDDRLVPFLSGLVYD